MTISIGTEKGFDKIQHPVMIFNNSLKSRNMKKLPQPDNGIY